MIFDENLLLAYGAEYEHYRANETIFTEGNHAKYYFQIVKGIVLLNSYSSDGKEVIYNIVTQGESIGESGLFIEKPYTMNALVATDCTVLKLSKIDFKNLLSSHSDASLNMFKCFSEKLYNKDLMMNILYTSNVIFKIKTLIDYLKGEENDKQYSFQVPITRQQLANLIGLRVETVIRAVKKMEKQNILKIENGKILY